MDPRNQPAGLSPEQQQVRRAQLIKHLIEFDAGIHLLVGGFLLFLICLMFAWKFNLIDYFSGRYTVDATEITSPAVYFTPHSEASNTTSGVYINHQVVPIEKAFESSPERVKLTSNPK